MYKSLSEMKPGQKFVSDGEVLTIKGVYLNGFAYDMYYGISWSDSVVDWPETNALYTQDYTAEIHALLERQRARGLKTYGVSLEDSNLSAIDAIDYMAEEITDMLQYALKLKHRLMEKGE